MEGSLNRCNSHAELILSSVESACPPQTLANIKIQDFGNLGSDQGEANLCKVDSTGHDRRLVSNRVVDTGGQEIGHQLLPVF